MSRCRKDRAAKKRRRLRNERFEARRDAFVRRVRKYLAWPSGLSRERFLAYVQDSAYPVWSIETREEIVAEMGRLADAIHERFPALAETWPLLARGGTKR